MEINVKGKATLEDMTTFYKEIGARTIGYRVFGIILKTFLILEFVLLLIMRKFNGNGGEIVFFVLFGFYFVYLIYRKLNFPRAVKKVYDSDSTFSMETETIFYEDRFESKSETVTEIFKKENIYYVMFGTSAVYIYKSRAKAEIVPKHFFETDEQWNTFVEFVKQNYVPGPKKSRIYKPLKWWGYLLSILGGVTAFAVMVAIIYVISY